LPGRLVAVVVVFAGAGVVVVVLGLICFADTTSLFQEVPGGEQVMSVTVGVEVCARTPTSVGSTT